MEDWRLKMEPWRAYRPVVADSHNDQQDPGPHLRKSWNRIRIRIKVMRIRNPGTEGHMSIMSDSFVPAAHVELKLLFSKI
jgi:hypothetical protein